MATRWLKRTSLFVAVILTVTTSIVIAFTAYMVLHALLPTGTDSIQPKDLTQFSLVIAAGIGGVVALVVSYRRQLDIELGRFVERFGVAASQLGNSDVAVRLSGAYAMAGVADESEGHQRQQCIDVLCGYLRLPYTPDKGSNSESELVHKIPARGGKEERTHKYLYRQDDKEVRQTIVRVIAAHLQGDARVSWSACDFDFTGGYLEDASFSAAVFGGRAVFTSVTFGGRRTSFDGAKFCGTWSSFEGAKFTGFMTSFTSTVFDDGVSFTNSKFDSELTYFQGTEFRGGWVWFSKTRFGSDWTSFEFATFDADMMKFEGSTFSSRGGTSFDYAAFGCGSMSFRDVEFGDQPVSFEQPSWWYPSPSFDWDDELPLGERKPKPTNVGPASWPPEVVEPEEAGPPAMTPR